MTHNLHTKSVGSVPYMFDILSHTSHPMLLSCLRLFSQIRSSISAAAGCVIYTGQKNAQDKFAAIFMLPICEAGMIFGLQHDGRNHWSMTVWRRFLQPGTFWTHTAWSLRKSQLHSSSFCSPLHFCPPSFHFFFNSALWKACSTGWLMFTGATQLPCLALIPCVSY